MSDRLGIFLFVILKMTTFEKCPPRIESSIRGQLIVLGYVVKGYSNFSIKYCTLYWKLLFYFICQLAGIFGLFHTLASIRGRSGIFLFIFLPKNVLRELRVRFVGN